MTPTTPETAPRWFRQRPILAVVSFFAIGLFLIGLATAGSSDQRPENTLAAVALPVHAATAIPQPGYLVERNLLGRIEARRSSPVGFELAGQVERVYAEEGEAVAAGSLLAKLDTDRLEAHRAELEAERLRARAALELAQSTAERFRQARALDAVAAQELDEAEIDVRIKEAQLHQAASAVERLDVEIRKSRLRAPFNAIVAARMTDEGHVVSAGQPILHLLENTAPEARIQLAGEAVGQVQAGESYPLMVGGKALAAKARSVLPLRRPGTRSVEAIFTLDDPQADVRDGDLARLKLTRFVEEPGFWVPTSALTESSRGLWAIYTIAESSGSQRIERRELEVLHQVEDRAYVRGTLESGDRFVVDGRHRLVPGQAVTPAATVEAYWNPQTAPPSVGGAP